MQARHSYITTHMFYEDLRSVQDSLPPKDIYEQLNSKDETDELMGDLAEEERKMTSQMLVSDFEWQNSSDESEGEADGGQQYYFDRRQKEI